MASRFLASSIPGSHHPNEDAWAADAERGAFAVCDGVTSSYLVDGSYPPWAGGAEAARLAADALVSAPGALAEALAGADRLIAELNAGRDDGEIDYLVHDVFNCTAVAAIVEHGRAAIACLGDAAALIQPAKGAARLITQFDTDAAEHLRDHELRDMPTDERAVLFRRELRNRVEPWRGRERMGFGVLDGTGRYPPLTQWREVELRPGDRLYLASDTVGRALAMQKQLPEEPEATFEVARAWEASQGITRLDDLTVLIVEGG